MTRPGELFHVAIVAGGRGRRLAAATALFMLHAVAEAMIPVLIGVTIDRAITPRDGAALALWLAVLAAVFLVLTCSYQGGAALMVRVYGYGEQAVRHAALTRLLHPRLLRRPIAAGEALSVVTSDAYRVAGVAWAVAEQGATVAAVLASTVMMLVISPLAAVAVVVATVGMLLLMRVVSRGLEARGHAEQAAAARASSVAVDLMAGYRVLLGIRARDAAVARYRAASASSRTAAVASGRALAGASAVSSILAGLTTAALAGITAWVASGGGMTIGELVTVLGLAQFITGYLAHIGSFPSEWIHKRASARRVADVIDAPHLLEPPADAAPTAPAEGASIAFTLGGHDVVIREGEFVGVRVTGGDTARALSRRLGRRDDGTRGRIRLAVDGSLVDADGLDPQEYRRHVVSLPYRATVFSGTLRSAVAGTGEPDDRLVDAAALHDATSAGWDRQVGESGLRLSGGQRQRVALARGLHARGSVLVLDEPTSAVDPVTESRIAASLRAHSGTVVVVTGSPVLLAACDRVVDLMDGADA